MSRLPLEPDRGEARRWAVEELSRREYAAARPGLVERIVGWLLDQLSAIPLPNTPADAVLLGVVLAAGVAGLTFVLWRARGVAARTARRDPLAVLPDLTRTAADLRAASVAHADGGRWDAAVRDRFRAVARELEERAVLDPQPGRTAAEVAGQAAGWLPEQAPALVAASRVFDDVAYGDRPGRPDAYAGLVALDDAVRRARVGTSPAPGVPGGLVLPR